MKIGKAVIVIFLISFLYALPTYNKFWFPFDEGMTLASVDIVMAGGVPYKDFVTPFGPAQFYILSLLFKIFGTKIEIAHLYIIFLHAIICTVIFYLGYKFSMNKRWAIFIWLIGLSSLAPRIGSAAWSIWPFVFFSILSALSLIFYIERQKIITLLIAGFLAGSAILCRYEFGLYLAMSEFISLISFLFITGMTGKSKTLLLYCACVIVLPAAFILYIWNIRSFNDFLYSISLPYTLIIKYGHNAFPPPCLDLRKIFYGSLYFITINQHYIPIIVYFVTIISTVYLYVRKKIDPVTFIQISFLVLLGIAIFTYAYFGADVTHTMPVMFPAFILSAFIIRKGMARADDQGNMFSVFVRIAAYLIIFLLVLLAIKNTDKYFKNVYQKPYLNKIIPVKTKRGSVYVPTQEAEDIKNLIKYIGENVQTGERFYMGFNSHKNIAHGGEPLIYFLSERLPCTKYFIMFPGVANQETIQKEIIESLKNVRLVVLGTEGEIVVNAEDIKAGSGLLDKYIRSEYEVGKRFGKYVTYLRR